MFPYYISMVDFFIDDKYKIMPNSLCTSMTNLGTTLSETKHQCSADPSCTMFYDVKGEGTTFKMCDQDAEIKESTSGTVLFVKRSEYNSICTPICKPIIFITQLISTYN